MIKVSDLYNRICPGKELAQSMLFINIAMALAVFDIRKAVDNNGREIEPICEYTPGTISYVPFPDSPDSH